eukprot:6199949-Pleurochrysis_carterae.AAC.2
MTSIADSSASRLRKSSTYAGGEAVLGAGLISDANDEKRRNVKTLQYPPTRESLLNLPLRCTDKA